MVQTQPGVFEPRDVKLGYQGPREVVVTAGPRGGRAGGERQRAAAGAPVHGWREEAPRRRRPARRRRRRRGRAAAASAGQAMKRLIQYALHQPLFIMLGTLLFAMAGVVRVQEPAGRGLPRRDRHPGHGDRAVPGPRRRRSREAGHAADRGRAVGPAELDPRVLAHAVRPVVHRRHLRRQGRRQPGARSRSPSGCAASTCRRAWRPTSRPTPRRSARSCATACAATAAARPSCARIEDWTVERALRQVPGVADVVAMGGFIKQYEVQPDLDKLRAYKLTFQNLLDALGRGNCQRRRQLRARRARSSTPSAASACCSRPTTSAASWWPRAAARRCWSATSREVKIGAVPRLGVVGQDDDDDVVTGIVVMRKGENPSVVLKGVKDKIADLNDARAAARACRSCRSTTAPG